MEKKTKKFKLGKNALVLSIVTLITVLSWIFFEVYRTMVKSTIPQLTQEQMKVLSPKINTTTVQTLKSRLFLSEEELNIVTTTSPEE